MKGWKIHFYILLAAAALRVLYLSQYLRVLPFLEAPVSDSLVYDQSARTLEWWNHPNGEPFHFSPGYTLWLSGFYHTVGSSPVAVVVIQLFIGLGIILLIGRIAEDLFGFRAGVLAEAGAGLFGPFLFYETKLLAATPALAAMLGALLLLIRGRREGRMGLLAAGGAVCGAAVAFRPNLLPMIPLIGLWVPLSFPRGRFWKRAAIAGCVVVCATLAVVPFTLINYRATGELILLTDSAGTTFYFGNNPNSRGRHGRPAGFRGAAEYQYEDSKRIAEQEAGRALSPGEISDYWFRKGLAWMRRHPGGYVLLELRKLFLLLNNREGEATFNFDFERSLLWSLRIPFLGFGFFLAAGLGGMVLAFSDRSARGNSKKLWDHALLLLPAASATLMCLMFFVRARYRLPMVPVLIVFSSGALVRLVDVIQAYRSRVGWASLMGRFGWIALGVTLAVLPITAAPTGEQRITPTAWNNLGGSFLRRYTQLADPEDLGKAEFCFQRALRLESAFPQAHLNLALVALARRPPDVEKARAAIREARRYGLPVDQSLLDFVDHLDALE